MLENKVDNEYAVRVLLEDLSDCNRAYEGAWSKRSGENMIKMEYIQSVLCRIAGVEIKDYLRQGPMSSDWEVTGGNGFSGEYVGTWLYLFHAVTGGRYATKMRLIAEYGGPPSECLGSCVCGEDGTYRILSVISDVFTGGPGEGDWVYCLAIRVEQDLDTRHVVAGRVKFIEEGR